MMQGLLLPAALRFVFRELVYDSETGEGDEEPGWKEEWLEYCKTGLGKDDDPRDFSDDNLKQDWIDDAVMRFCENSSFIDRIRNSIEAIE